MNRKQWLEKLLTKEMERMRLICFKYQRRPLLSNKIIICIEDLGKEVAGRYTEIDKKNDFNFTHKIIINEKILDSYFNYKQSIYDVGKKYYKQQILKTITHEIVHAFVNEVFELVTDTIGTHRDASPIFLSVLFFLNGTSNYNFVTAFLQSEFWKEAQKHKSWDELHLYLIQKLTQYRKVTYRLNNSDNSTYVTNNFQFSHRNAGLIGNYHNVIDTYSLTDKKKGRLITNIWEIGCCITPKQIHKLVNKKQDNLNFDNVQKIKMYVNSDTKKMINKKNDEKYTIGNIDEQLKKLDGNNFVETKTNLK